MARRDPGCRYFQRDDRRGFSLVEIMLVSILLAVLLSAGLVFHENLRRNSDQIFKRQYAIKLAASQIEDLLQLAETDFTAGTTMTAGAHTGPTPSVQSILAAGYDVQYAIEDRDLPNDGDAGDDPAANGADYKVVKVTVAYPGGHTLTMNGVIFEP